MEKSHECSPSRYDTHATAMICIAIHFKTFLCNATGRYFTSVYLRLPPISSKVVNPRLPHSSSFRGIFTPVLSSIILTNASTPSAAWPVASFAASMASPAAPFAASTASPVTA